jgi:hypothetical protein
VAQANKALKLTKELRSAHRVTTHPINVAPCRGARSSLTSSQLNAGRTLAVAERSDVTARPSRLSAHEPFRRSECAPAVTSLMLTLAMSCTWQPGYKAALRAFQAELSSRNAVPCIQGWLAQRPKVSALPESSHPDCISELKPERIMEAEPGGVAVAVRRGERFILVVFPPGQRPKRRTHEPSMERPGYVGEFGPDAYIEMIER